MLKWFRDWWTRPSAQQQLLDILREITIMQRTQSEFFNTLAKTWTAPVLDNPAPYVHPDDKETLVSLHEAANAGDADAKLLLGDPKALHDYLDLFH